MTKLFSNEDSKSRFGEKDKSRELGIEEMGFMLRMIEENSHSGKHLELALQVKLKLQGKINKLLNKE